MASKTYASVFSSPIVEEIPDTIKDAILYSVLNNTDIPTEMLGATIKSISNKSRRFLRYGRDVYSKGQPTVDIIKETINRTGVISAISSSESIPEANISIADIFIDEEADEFIVRNYLRDTYDWNENDNILFTNTSGTDVTYVGFNESSTDPLLLNISSSEGFLTQIAGGNNSNKYYLVRWTDSAQPGVANYWVYNISDGTYPDLDESNGVLFGSDYFPIVTIRRDKTSYNNDTNSLEYTETRKILDKIDLDLDDLIAGIEENPDIGVIDDVFVTFSVDVYSKKEADIRYMIEYFKELGQADVLTEADWLANTDDYPLNELRFREEDHSSNFKFAYIKEEILTGSIGDVGHVESEITTGFSSRLFLRTQISATEFEKITIALPSLTIEVRVSNAAKGTSGYRAKYISKGLESDTEDLEQHGFLIPVSVTTVRKLKPKDRSALLYSSLHLVIYAVQVVKLKWYQTDAFKIIMTIIAVGLALYTGGQSLVTAAAIGAKAVALLIIKALILKALLDYTVDWLYRNLDAETALILSIVLMAAVGQYMGEFDIMSGFSAENLMHMVTLITDSIGTFTQHEYAATLEEFGEFNEAYEAEKERLDALEAELGFGESNGLPLYIQSGFHRPIVNFNSRPTQYYHNAIHDTNPGIRSLGIVEHFVHMKLQLPVVKNPKNFDT